MRLFPFSIEFSDYGITIVLKPVLHFTRGNR